MGVTVMRWRHLPAEVRSNRIKRRNCIGWVGYSHAIATAICHPTPHRGLTNATVSRALNHQLRLQHPRRLFGIRVNKKPPDDAGWLGVVGF